MPSAKKLNFSGHDSRAGQVACLRETIREQPVHARALLATLTDTVVGKQSDKRVDLDEFSWRSLGDAPQLLRESFRLRYQSYCERQKFLDASNYPDGCEYDEFDRHSLHVGVMHDKTNTMAATARIVYRKNSFHTLKLPLYDHCSVHDEFHDFLEKTQYVGEISRFVMSTEAVDRIVECSSPQSLSPADPSNSARLKASLPAILTLYKSIYQISRINGIAVLVAAMEQSLRRLVSRFRFPFHQIGPEIDYYGPVAPFLLDLDELDDVLFDEAPWLLAEFYRGLEGHDIQTVWSMPRQYSEEAA
jgi:N-acyl amino acid synthase of PEP-CTERM/exosortase system